MIYLALGTNLGDRKANLSQACTLLTPQVLLLAASPIYETAPWGYPDQPAFLNQVVQVETNLAPLDLLAYIKQIEVHLGRKASFLYGPRLIDLDILLYHDQIIELPDLIIPHPYMSERAFVLVPLEDLAPTLKLPVFDRTAGELLAEIGRDGVSLYPEL